MTNTAADDAFADEIVEIFVEEVEEVLQQIDEHFPKWENNPDNEASLKEIRRAYHTLKGSGRMVQAEVIGEVAWAVESMLNRILDKTLKPNPAAFALVKDVTAIVPALVTAFAKNQSLSVTGVEPEQYIQRANEIVAGTLVDAPAEEGAIIIDEEVADEGGHVTELPAAANSQAFTALEQRVTELSTAVEEINRNLVTMGTQLDTLTTQLNLMPKSSATDVFKRELDMANNDIQELKYFVKSSSEQVQKEFATTQQKFSSRINKELQDVSDLGTQLNADSKAIADDIRRDMTADIKRWSVGCSVVAVIAAVAVMMMQS